MNTGDRNTMGRVILRGPRGGLYVIGPSGAKLRTFKKAAPAPPARTALNNAKAHMNTLKTAVARKAYVRSRANMSISNLSELSRYKATLDHRASLVRAAKKAGAAPAPRVATPPALAHAIAHMTKLKTASGRVRYMVSMRDKLTAANFAVLGRHHANLRSPKTPVIATVERNKRLAAIRARLNAIRVARRAAIPKERKNVHKRLKNAVARVRTRLAPIRMTAEKPVRSILRVPFCHAPASVPRKGCTMREADISVYRSPLIDDGTVVATRKDDIDLDWFKRQDKYVKGLSDYDFWTAQAHTNRSHGWIGPFMYAGRVTRTLPSSSDNRHILPLWPQFNKMIGRSYLDGWTVDQTNDYRLKREKERYEYLSRNAHRFTASVFKKALKMYRDDLERIIAGAPKSRKKMVLYRGATFDIFRNTVGHWHTLTSFCSAAYNFTHAIGYGNTMQRITVLPGSPVLLVAGMNQWNVHGEYEIMVNVGTKYLIRKRNVRRAGWSGNRHILDVTDVTITK